MLVQTEQATKSCDNKNDFVKIARSETWEVIWGRGALFFGGWWVD